MVHKCCGTCDNGRKKGWFVLCRITFHIDSVLSGTRCTIWEEMKDRCENCSHYVSHETECGLGNCKLKSDTKYSSDTCSKWLIANYLPHEVLSIPAQRISGLMDITQTACKVQKE